jgi:ubiquitin carboxyl-terminal hydrolase 4/11/15
VTHETSHRSPTYSEAAHGWSGLDLGSSKTASSQKKRKLAPFTVNSGLAINSSQTLPDLPVDTDRPNSSSPIINSDSQSSSPTSSHITQTGSPLRFIPPHLQDEVQEASSPSAAFAEIRIDRAGSVEMSGSDGVANSNVDLQTAATGSQQIGRAMSVRSASPAKRSATEMEDNHAAKSAEAVGGSTVENGDTAMESFSGQEKVAEVVDSTAQSVEEDPPPYSETDAHPIVEVQEEPYTTEQIDQQVQHVTLLTEKLLDEGQRGVVISQRWLNRVLSRTTRGLQNSEYPKECREGPVGPVDNSDIVPDAAYMAPLHDSEGQPYIPLRPELTEGADFAIIPMEAYSYVIGTYGSLRKTAIIRYAHNTVDGGQNVQYELYPPRITIRKVPKSKSDSDAVQKPTSTLENLKLRQEQASRGQASPDDAAQLIVSRFDRFQRFLSRSKEAAGIPRGTKVKLWRVLSVESEVVAGPQPEIFTPPASQDDLSTEAMTSVAQKLVVDPIVFKDFEIGRDIEAIEAKDETNNSNYNGKSTTGFVGITSDQIIILEEQVGTGNDFRSDKQKPTKLMIKKQTNGTSGVASGATSPGGNSVVTRGRARKGGRVRGQNGLQNLGNTCYMNSALQCIRSIEELSIYFLSKKFKKDINNDNPLGYHGAMATAYDTVVRALWEGTSYYSPSNFKRQIGNVNYQFSSYGQQDSQEFLSTLVDALHEDLNRIKVKPYQPYPDSDDELVHDPQAIIDLGNVYRKIFVARNDSVAMDLFLGFYKNTIECPDCRKISITFDPYSSLTLQLPIEDNFSGRITFFPLRGKPVNHDIDMDKNTTIKTVKQSIADKHPGADANRMWMAEVYSHKIYRVFEDKCSLADADIKSSDHVFLFELDGSPTNVGEPRKSLVSYKRIDDSIPTEGMESPQAECIAVPVYSRVSKSRFSAGSPSHVMHPIYISLTREEAKNYDIIMKKVLIAVARLTTKPILSDLDEKFGWESKTVEEGGEGSKEEIPEDGTGVSDHSAEDGYVNVSIDQAPASAEVQPTANEVALQDGIPQNFMDPGYFLSPGLRDHLFEMKVARGDNMHCASVASITTGSIRNMFEQVKPAARRSSIQTVDSATSTQGSDSGENITEDDEVDDQDEPDIVVGGEGAQDQVEDSDEDAATEPTIMEPSPVPLRGNGRRRGTKHGRKNRHGKLHQRHTKNQRMPVGSQHRVSADGTASIRSPPASNDDNPYYVRIGEAIILDWLPEAYDSLFEGDPLNEDELRGSRTTTDICDNLETFHDAELVARKEKRKQRNRNGITLDACFDETSKSEVLSEENKWYCNRCKETRRARKQLQIWTLPDILIVHLKRFSNRTMRGKIDVLVDYPIEGLDLNEKVGLKEDGKDYTYDLFAVDNHSGSLGGGHYTAFAKNFEDSEWYDYNDSMCHKIHSVDRLKTSQAYLLFYRRRSSKPLGPKYLQELVEEYRNPPAESEADGAEPGEARLDGPLTSLHGSSGDSAAAGAGAATTTNNNRARSAIGSDDGGYPAGEGHTADSPLTTTLMTTEHDGGDWRNHPVTQFRQFGDQGESSWSFQNVDNDDVHPFQRDDDIDSNIAEHDRDNDSAFAEGGSSFFDQSNSRPRSPLLENLDFEDNDVLQFGEDLQMNDADHEPEVADIRIGGTDDEHDDSDPVDIRRYGAAGGMN